MTTAEAMKSDPVGAQMQRTVLVTGGSRGSGGYGERLHSQVHLLPMQRAGTTNEVAEAIVWLLSDAASYTTGALLDVAGGR